MESAFATRESLYAIREKELKRATNILGIKDLRMMGYRDKTLEFETPGELRRVIQKCVEELNPSLVISFILDMQFIQIMMQQEKRWLKR